jgi:signal transduction histidine kinase
VTDFRPLQPAPGGRPRLPLRVRLSVGSSLRLSVAILAFAAFAYYTSKRAAIEATEGRARATAYSMAQRTTVGLRGMVEALAEAAAHPAVVAAAQSGVPSPEARAVLERLPRDSDQTVAIGLRTTSGQTVLSVRGDLPTWAVDESRRPEVAAFGQMFAHGDSVLYEAVAPVLHQGTVVGSVVRVRRLTATPAGIRTVADLLGAQGELLFGNADGSLWTDITKPVEGPADSGATRYHRDDRTFVSGVYPIDDTPFQFAVGFPEDLVLAPVRGMLWTLISIGGAIILLGFVASWWANGRVTRPLTELATAAEAITTRYQPGQSSASASGDELGRLQRAFSTMEKSVQTAHSTLQDRVRETTEALEQLTAERARLEETLQQLERSEEALRTADRRKDVFLATLAHELRNPLAPIRNAAHILKLKSNGAPDLQWGHQVIDRQVAQMSRLLDDLLDLSRVSHDRLSLRRERIDLTAVVQHAVETSRPLIEAGQHELSIALPGEPLVLNGDPVRLGQVFSNLLNNSSKYTESGGHIRIAAHREGREVVVSVTDDGIGIAADDLPQIFDRFAQVRSAQERSLPGNGDGLGIGLSLVRGLVSLHGGTVAAASAGLGRGSEFTVRLPLHQEPLGPAMAPAAAATEAGKQRLLIADDLKDNTDSLAEWLRLHGHDVVTAYDGASAVAAAAQVRPQIVVLDLGMPVMDGYEACRRIRAETWGRDMVVVALTGWGHTQDRRRSEEAGFDCHLVKPIDPLALLDLLASPGRLRTG